MFYRKWKCELINIIGLTVLAVVCGSYQLCASRNFVPQSHFLVWDVPQPYFPIKGSGNEKLIILWVESQGGDAVDVLENAETVFSGNVPQPDCLVH